VKSQNGWMRVPPDPTPKSKALIELGKLAYLDPRLSARVILNMELEEKDRLLMIGFAIALGAFGFALTSAIAPTPEAGAEGVPSVRRGGLPAYFVFILMGFAQYWIQSGAVWFLGRSFGGKADLDESKTAVAWWSVVTSPLQAIQGLALVGAPQALGLTFVLVTGALVLWTLASFVAEAHRFESSGKTMLGILGILLGVAFVLALFLGGSLQR